MYEEISYKFKDILNRIFNCIDDYINKNIKNPNLVESKLLSINNYIIDLLHTNESPHNSFINNNRCNSQADIFPEKVIFNQLISSREYEEKKKTVNKYKRKYFNNIIEKSENAINNHHKDKDDYNLITNENMQCKFKIIKLKRKLKSEQEKNKIKELSYLQRLSYIQKKLNLYESKNNKENPKQKGIKQNLFNYFTINNSYNNNRNVSNNNMNVYQNNSKIIKHSMSQCEMRDNRIHNETNNIKDMKLKYELFRKKKNLKKNNFIKFDFGEMEKINRKKNG